MDDKSVCDAAIIGILVFYPLCLEMHNSQNLNPLHPPSFNKCTVEKLKSSKVQKFKKSKIQKTRNLDSTRNTRNTRNTKNVLARQLVLVAVC